MPPPEPDRHPEWRAPPLRRRLGPLPVTCLTAVIGVENVYAGDHRVGATIRRAYDDALAWVAGIRDRGESQA